MTNVAITVTAVNDAPVVTASAAPDAVAAGAATTTVTVIFPDIDGVINVGTLGVTDIVVTGPGGPVAVTGVSVSPAGSGTPRTATYTLAAPGGTLDSNDNGAYTVALVAGDVSDAPPPVTFRVETEDFAVLQGFVVGNLGVPSGGRCCSPAAASRTSISATSTRTMARPRSRRS